MKKFTYSLVLLMLVACESSVSQSIASDDSNEFNQYWYAGEAEISSYSLSQARYGEIHQGTAVMVFVTEPFSKTKQVKLDNWKDQSDDNVSVMKLNLTKKFLTGIYPYSMMMSTFTPVDLGLHSKTFKITTSSQEWCGHTFMQLNVSNNNYQLRGYSYFESEGDVNLNIGDVMAEDELFTRIRINPKSLPTGNLMLLPSTFFLRLRHQEARASRAELTLSTIDSSPFAQTPHNKYAIRYKNRELMIYFEPEFPHEILGWEETYLSGFGRPERLTTIAKRNKTIKSAYWGKNSNEDRKIRKELGLSLE